MEQRKDRETLKSYFKKGSIPTEEQFAALIDSVPNIVEDGQVVRTAEGWAFFPETGKPLQISLHESETDPAVWTLCLTPEKGLAVKNASGQTVVELGQDLEISLPGNEVVEPSPEPEPEYEAQPAPAPVPDYMEIRADKKWNDLVQVPYGKGNSRIYNVFALFRDPDFATASLTRATAIFISGSGWSVESGRRHWWGWSGGVKLRWHTKDGKACLQIRSRHVTLAGKIHCRVSESFSEQAAETSGNAQQMSGRDHTAE